MDACGLSVMLFAAVIRLRALFRLFFLNVLLLSESFASAQTARFTRAADIRSLTADQATLAYPVHVRGVITDDVPSPDYFVQDGTAGIYVEGNPAYRHRFGDEIEIDGVTAPGFFAPVIHERSMRVLGPGTLPPARPHTFPEFAAGELDSQWMLVRGIVRTVSLDRTSWPELTLVMDLASGGGNVRARVPIDHEQDMSDWIGREISFRGVCGSLFNAERQLKGILFYVPRLSLIQVAPAPPVIAIRDLLRFSPFLAGRPRVRVCGTVTYQQPGRTLFIESGGSGLRAYTDQPTRVEVGQRVEVFGVPATGESAPVLQEAAFRAIKGAETITPQPLEFSAPMERFDGSLVKIQATVIHTGPQQLVLQRGQAVFTAGFDSDASGSAQKLPPGSRLDLTGICLVRNGGLWSVPESVRVLLRRPSDVHVVCAPWWTETQTVWALGSALGVLAVVLTWSLVLKKRLFEQRELVRQELRTGAILQERNRIARELHDTLEQHLAGITMQLDVAAHCLQDAPGLAERALNQARRMTRHSMLEARRSVWDLRCHLLENGDLYSALNETLKPWTEEQRVELELRVSGEPVRLSYVVELNLLRIGQEAVANALKHAQAARIVVHLDYRHGVTRLEVSDDGIGFEKPGGNAAMEGHFGLLDMYERAASLSCDLLVESAANAGTRIIVEVPPAAQQLRV